MSHTAWSQREALTWAGIVELHSHHQAAYNFCKAVKLTFRAVNGPLQPELVFD